jgi:glycosyltransferase involved in cell wall biosynthesis
VTLYPFHRVPIRTSPAVVTLHDMRTFHPEFYSRSDVEIIRRNVAGAAAVVVSWPHPYHQVLEMFPEAAAKTALIPLPVFHARPSGATPRTDSTTLIYPSSTARHKNHENLIEAMAHLPDLELVCPGPLVEPQASRLKAKVRELSLSSRVHFPGFVSTSELSKLYAEAAAVVVPSMWEAASGAVFEAFSWGLPVACSDVAPLRAQVEFAGAQVSFFDGTDPGSIAAAVRALLADRKRLVVASKLAGQRLGERTWADTGRDYSDVFEWVHRGSLGSIPTSRFVSERRISR